MTEEAAAEKSRILDLAAHLNVTINAVDARGLYTATQEASDQSRGFARGMMWAVKWGTMRNLSAQATYPEMDKGVVSDIKLNGTTHAQSHRNSGSARPYCGHQHSHRELLWTDTRPRGAKAFLLHLGIFVPGIPLVIVERWSQGVNAFRGEPRWVVRSMQVFFLLFVAVFFVFLALSHAAAPEIINGEYVLRDHGRIAGYISEREYFFLKGWELRLFATGWMVVYYALMMYWWFPRQEPWTVVMPD